MCNSYDPLHGLAVLRTSTLGRTRCVSAGPEYACSPQTGCGHCCARSLSSPATDLCKGEKAVRTYSAETWSLSLHIPLEGCRHHSRKVMPAENLFRADANANASACSSPCLTSTMVAHWPGSRRAGCRVQAAGWQPCDSVGRCKSPYRAHRIALATAYNGDRVFDRGFGCQRGQGCCSMVVERETSGREVLHCFPGNTKGFGMMVLKYGIMGV